MFSFGLQLVVILIVIAGIIAYVGDYLGTKIGKRRLTLLGFRPHHTAIFITIISGILIALITFTVILSFSQEARTAFFGLEKLRKELSQKSLQLEQKVEEINKIDIELSSAHANLEKARKEIAQLEKARNKLSRQIEVSRKGKILFNVGEILLTSVVTAGPEKEKLEGGLRQILSAADAYVRTFGANKQEHLIYISPDNFNLALESLEKNQGENIAQVLVLQNTLFGEIVPVHFSIYPNRVIYKSGAVIAKRVIPPSLSTSEIEREIRQLLALTHQSALQAGVIPDASGSVGSIPYNQISSLAKKVSAYKQEVRVESQAKKDIYSLGPLEVELKLFYQ